MSRLDLTEFEYLALIVDAAEQLALACQRDIPSRQGICDRYRRIGQLLEAAYPPRKLDQEEEHLDKIWAKLRDSGDVAYRRPKGWRSPQDFGPTAGYLTQSDAWATGALIRPVKE